MPHTGDLNEILKDLSIVYSGPEGVMADRLLTTEVRDKILEVWEGDTNALLRAADENMPANKINSKAAKQIHVISKLRRHLRQD